MNDKIILRSMNEKDIEYYNKWSNDFEVVQYTYPVIRTFTLDETRKFYEKILSSSNSITLVIEDVEASIPIGITSIINIDSINGNAEFIIDIGDKNYWGKGIGKVVTRKMIAYAFDKMSLHRISLRVFSFNERAIKLYKDFGFIEEGRIREAIYRYNKRYDIIHMGLLREEH